MIPISEYIAIKTRILSESGRTRDFSGLVFSKVAMKTVVPTEYAEIKAKYEGDESDGIAPSVITLSRSGVVACFDDADFLAEMSKYFSYSGGSADVTRINFALVGDSETASAAYSRVTAEFANFGSFGFYDITEGLSTVATTNDGNEYGWVMVVGTTAATQSTDAPSYANNVLTHLTHAPFEAMGWYAAVNYDVDGSAATIDYKQFPGSIATVTTLEGKTAADELFVNYIGKVQDYGLGTSFYQNGVNMSGDDLGIVRDACWMNSEIVRAYFNLQTSVSKIPANHLGIAMIKNIIIGVATRGIFNGSILVDKPLSNTQKSLVLSYTDDVTAIETINLNGFYIAAELITEDNRTVCQYTLVYAKGDHIGKVEGLHVLV